MPETIEAQELCGAHVGRIVQFTIVPAPALNSAPQQKAAPIAGELAGVSHDGHGTSISLRGFAGYRDAGAIGAMGGQFLLRALDLVAVDAFLVVESR